MKSITIHGMDAKLYERIKEKAKCQGLSLNKTIKNLLEMSLGTNDNKSGDHHEDFVEFCGVWSEKETHEFEKATEDFRKIDTGDWQ
jgi:hypothetical protein